MRRTRLALTSSLIAGIVLFLVAGPLVSVAQDSSTEEAEVVPEIPASARAVKNPVPAGPQAVANGRLFYSSQCAMCHGKTGDGKGDLVERLKLTVPDFTKAEVQKARTDGEWFYILTEGHGRMKGEGGRLNETTRWELIHFLRSLGPES